MNVNLQTTRLGSFPPAARYFGGGGRTAIPTTPPITAAPAPAVVAPPTTNNAEVIQAQNDLRRQSLKKRGFSKTVVAGDTGGWNSSNFKPGATPPPAGATKLGA